MGRLLLLAACAAALLCTGAGQAAAAGWCGSGETAQNRTPDLPAGPDVHVVYAYPSDGTDAFAQQAPQIADDVAAVDAWWRGQDPARTPRFDLFDFGGGCTALDLGSLRLSPTAAQLEPNASRFDLIEQALPPLDPEVKLVVYYDGPLEDPNVCGTGGGEPDTGLASLAVVYVRSSCATSTGARAAILAHELVHELGAMPPGAGEPHACPGDAEHVCDSPDDLLYPFLSHASIDELVLDVGRDDYYRHGGSWFDVASSQWLRRLDVPQQPLTVRISGGGSVSADLPGLACTSTCTTEWDGGTLVSLRATAAAGRRFVGWQGACSGFFCTPTLQAPTTVEAVFGPARVRLAARVSGRGSVAGAGLACPRRCAASVRAGQPLAVRARPAKGWALAGWGGACSGTKPVCRLTPQAAATVTARFRRG